MSYCHEKGLFCEFARASGYCTSTGCNKLATVTYEIRTMTPATNADHIRSMSDEELAAFWVLPVCGLRTREECEKNFRTNCEACFFDWLKQPYGGDT